MGRPPKQTSLFWRETRQRILGHEISPYPEVVRGREWQLTTRLREGSWRLESSRGQLATGQQRGKQQRVGGGTVGDKIGSSEEDRLKMSAFEVLVEFSLVTHASDSLHMHVVLHTFLCSWLTPSLFVFVRLSFYFLRSLDRILV